MLGAVVFKNAALRVTLDTEPAPGSDVAAFVEELREVPSLFFAPLPELPQPLPSKALAFPT